MKNVVATGTADASDIAMPVVRSHAPLIDTRVLTSLIAQSLHTESAWLRPVDLPARQVLRGATMVCWRSVRKRKYRDLLLTDVHDNPVAFVERIHEMPHHAR